MYVVEDLGPSLWPFAINDRGEIAGWNEGGFNAFYYSKPTGAVQIAPHFGYAYGVAWNINNRGQVVGTSLESSGHDYSRGFLWDIRTGMHDVPWLDGYQRNELFAINNAGTMIGVSRDFPGYPWTAYLIMQNGATSTIPTIFGQDINEQGQVAGSVINEAAVWDARNGISLLGTLGAQSYAHGLNNRGQVVGTSFDHSKPTEVSGFVWDKHTGMVRVGTPLDSFDTHLRDVNDRGEAVGYQTDGAKYGYAIIWDRLHGMRDMNALLFPFQGWHLFQAFDINERGQIVGIGYLNGEFHGFLATPRGT